MEPIQIYIEWRDCVGKVHYSGSKDDLPSSLLLRGITWLIEENDEDIVVAQFIAEDGGYMDMVAIPKAVLVKREIVKS